MPNGSHTFIVFLDLVSGNYRWRLRSPERETLAHSGKYPEKGVCEQEVRRLKAENYPEAEVLDLTIQRYDR